LRSSTYQGVAVKPVHVCAAVLAAAISLSGCGGAAAPTTAPAAATNGAGVTAASPVASSPETTTPPAGDLDGSGIATKMITALAKAGSGRFDMVSSGSAGGQQVTMTAKSEFVVVNGGMDSKATMTIAGGTMDVISVGGVMYMKGVFKAKNGKPWVKIDPNATDSFSKQMAPQLKSAADLRSQVEVYQGSTATLVGTDAGVRHYRLTGVSSAPTQPFDIYLDSQDRPVKVTTSSSSVDMTITYSGFGEPVTVSAPPDDQVGPPPSM
jgi:hypothetical protein